MQYAAVSKNSGKLVQFKSKSNMDAAVKAGTHSAIGDASKLVKKSTAKKAPIKKPVKKSVRTASKPKSRFAYWDNDEDRLVVFPDKSSALKALRSDKWRYKKLKTGGDTPKIFKKIKEEEKFYSTLISWIGASDKKTAQALNRLKNVLDLGKKKFPKIFKPDVAVGRPLYRGLTDAPKLIKLIQNSSADDWEFHKSTFIKSASSDGYTGVHYLVYKGPKKITYTPHRPAQSWSKSFGTAATFADDALLETPANHKDFYFSSRFIANLPSSVGDEDEIIRIGRKLETTRLIVKASTLLSHQAISAAEYEKMYKEYKKKAKK